MNDGSGEDLVRRAEALMRPPTVKRFYAEAAVGEADGGFAVRLDGRIARTPAKTPLIVPTRALAEAVAAEWAAQVETIAPASMPLTRLAHSALDGVARTLEETISDIAAYAGSDLVCYRALEPEALAQRQAAAFDPVLAFAERELGARFMLAGGIMPVAQPEASLRAVRAAMPREPFAVTALHILTTLSGSALMALMAAKGAISSEAAWAAAHVDEDFQIARWGADDEAVRRREARWRDFAAAAFALQALRG
jgi:chaperone required for assembly of F1-ATPase